ncbi:MAG: DUF2029 domain-containing protein, partial [Acidobacteria bacterium]
MRKRSGLALWILLAGTLLIKAVVLLQLHDHILLQPSPVLDDGVYVGLASRVASGDLAAGPDVYFVSPFYIYFMALVFSLTGGSTLAVRAVQVGLGTAAVGLVYATTRRWFGERSALAAGVLAALTGLFSFFEILLLQTAVDPFLTALSLYALTLAIRSGGLRWPPIAGACIGLLVMNRPNALPFVAVAVAGLWLLRRDRRGAARAASLALGAVLVIAPVTLRNGLVAGDWVLISSHGGLYLYIGNNSIADGTYRAVEGITPSIQGQLVDSRSVAERAAGRTMEPSEVSAYFAGRAFEWARTNPGDALRLFLLKLAYVFNGADLALNYSYTYFSLDEVTLLRLLVVGPWLLVPLGLAGLFAPVRVEGRAGFAVWTSFVPVYALSVAVFFVSTRYRLPLLVPLCATSGAFVAWLIDAVLARRGRHLAVAAVATASLALLANWPIGPDTGRA